MANDDEQIRAFLYEQWLWVQEQDLLLAKLEGKLKMMRELAYYQLEHQLNEQQSQDLQSQLEQLQREITEIEQQLEQGPSH